MTHKQHTLHSIQVFMRLSVKRIAPGSQHEAWIFIPEFCSQNAFHFQIGGAFLHFHTLLTRNSRAENVLILNI